MGLAKFIRRMSRIADNRLLKQQHVMEETLRRNLNKTVEQRGVRGFTVMFGSRLARAKLRSWNVDANGLCIRYIHSPYSKCYAVVMKFLNDVGKRSPMRKQSRTIARDAFPWN